MGRLRAGPQRDCHRRNEDHRYRQCTEQHQTRPDVGANHRCSHNVARYADVPKPHQQRHKTRTLQTHTDGVAELAWQRETHSPGRRVATNAWRTDNHARPGKPIGAVEAVPRDFRLLAFEVLASTAVRSGGTSSANGGVAAQGAEHAQSHSRRVGLNRRRVGAPQKSAQDAGGQAT